MQAEEEYERSRLAVEAEEDRKRRAKEEALRERLDAEGRMREENERSTAITQKLKVRPNNNGLFRVAEAKAKEARVQKTGMAFKDKLMGKVAARKAKEAAEAEEARKKKEAEDLAAKLSALDDPKKKAAVREPVFYETAAAPRRLPKTRGCGRRRGRDPEIPDPMP